MQQKHQLPFWHGELMTRTLVSHPAHHTVVSLPAAPCPRVHAAIVTGRSASGKQSSAERRHSKRSVRQAIHLVALEQRLTRFSAGHVGSRQSTTAGFCYGLVPLCAGDLLLVIPARKMIPVTNSCTSVGALNAHQNTGCQQATGCTLLLWHAWPSN
jgi:urease accessory protein UreH